MGAHFRQAHIVRALRTPTGLSAAALVTRLLEGMLYGVQPLDPVSFAGGAILFGTLALVASLIPARRAASGASNNAQLRTAARPNAPPTWVRPSYIPCG